MDEKILPVSPVWGNDWVGIGKEGVDKFLDLVQYPECSHVALNEDKKADYSVAAVNLRVLDSLSKGDMKPRLGYWNEKIRHYIVPALIYLEPGVEKPRLTKVVMGNIPWVRNESYVPDTWPSQINESTCKDYYHPSLKWDGPYSDSRRAELTSLSM